MANKHKGEVEIQFSSMGTRTFHLKFDANAWAEFEQRYGKSLSKAMEDIVDDNVGYHFMRCALYAGLQCNTSIKRGLTLEKCGRLLGGSDETDILEKVLRAVMLSRGVDIDELKGEENTSEADAGNDGAPVESTGTAIGATPTQPE